MYTRLRRFRVLYVKFPAFTGTDMMTVQHSKLSTPHSRFTDTVTSLFHLDRTKFRMVKKVEFKKIVH